MLNDLKHGKQCIGQTVINKTGEEGTITDMFTENGHKCMVTITYDDGTTHSREKFYVKQGAFKKPAKFDLKEYLKKGFQPIYQWEQFYIINKEGVIISLHKRNYGHIKKASNRYKYSSYDKKRIYTNPYKYVGLQREKKNTIKNILVHKLVVETFIRPVKENEEINHINGISNDNRLANLEIISRIENNQKYFSFNFLTEEEQELLYRFCVKENLNFKQAIQLFIKDSLLRRNNEIMA